MVDGRVVGCRLPHLAEQPNQPFSIISSNTDAASRFIIGALRGKGRKLPTLGKPEGTDFQRQVWHAIATIPSGRTKTYGELAEAIARPSACRAVANACGKNPLPLFIPCHRVVAANGKIGGFSAGLAWKKFLLAAEQNQ